MFDAVTPTASLLEEPTTSAEPLTFCAMRPEDPVLIERQPSQRALLGMTSDMTREEGEFHAGQRIAWTAWADRRRYACFGISETFEGLQGVAWSILAPGLGVARHLQLTRFMRKILQASSLARIELIATANDAEAILARWPDLDGAQLLEAVMVNPSRECAWARVLGLTPAHVLRKFGGASETCVLFERIG